MSHTIFLRDKIDITKNAQSFIIKIYPSSPQFMPLCLHMVDTMIMDKSSKERCKSSLRKQNFPYYVTCYQSEPKTKKIRDNNRIFRI